MLSDHIGLLATLQWIPLAGLGATVAFALGRRHYAADLGCGCSAGARHARAEPSHHRATPSHTDPHHHPDIPDTRSIPGIP